MCFPPLDLTVGIKQTHTHTHWFIVSVLLWPHCCCVDSINIHHYAGWKKPNGDGCFYSRKIKGPVSSSPLSSHQLQDGYSNNNSSSGSQQCVSQPATPGGALPVPSPLSPSPASLSSYHGDDSDSISSPPWPLKTPSSPVRTRNSNIIYK